MPAGRVATPSSSPPWPGQVPASAALPAWPRYTAADRAVMVIGAKPSVTYAPHGDRLDSWARLAPPTRTPLDF